MGRYKPIETFKTPDGALIVRCSTWIYTERHYPLMFAVLTMFLTFLVYRTFGFGFAAIAGISSIMLVVGWWRTGDFVNVWLRRDKSGANIVIRFRSSVVEHRLINENECKTIRHSGKETAMWNRAGSEITRQLRYTDENGQDRLFIDLLTMGPLHWSLFVGWRKLDVEQGDYLVRVLHEPASITVPSSDNTWEVEANQVFAAGFVLNKKANNSFTR